MPTVEARGRSGTSAPDHAAAAAAVSIRELIAPPWMTSPSVGSESVNGIESTARFGSITSVRMPRCATNGELSSQPRASAMPSACGASVSDCSVCAMCVGEGTSVPKLAGAFAVADACGRQATLSRMAVAARTVAEGCESAKWASRELPVATSEAKTAALERLAELLGARTAEILEANADDLADERAAGLTPSLRDRLTLDEARVA